MVRIPTEGGALGSGIQYELHRGNLAMNYLFVYNINIYTSIARQLYKTTSAVVWYLWVFNFGSTNIKMMFANKKLDDSKRNLQTLKNIREALPDYLRMESLIGPDGKQIKVPNRAETLQNPVNLNLITTLAGARQKQQAEGAGRGATMAIQWYDEFAFLPFNDIVYTAAAPAFSTASRNAKANGSPYGMLITTTPGDLTTREGQFADKMRLSATRWNEGFYDMSYQELQDLVNANKDSSFVYIEYSYQQLGRGPDYFAKMVQLLGKDWPKIRREILLEWAKTTDNNPFDREDLEVIEAMTKVEPRYTLFFGKNRQYQMNFWDEIPLGSTYPPIIGVDVSTAMYKDASAITVIDSETTKVIATLKSNFITSAELADIIYQFVTNYAKNAIVNIEANGIGASVIQALLKTSIKPNLYYEIKDRVIEEIINGVTVKRPPRKCKVVGSVSNKAMRDKLIELLYSRVKHHRDKFNTREIYDELCTMVVRPSGKVEHDDDHHDDLTFSYLWALYVWYYGEELPTRFHLMKNEIKTDDDYNETSYDLEEEYNETIPIEPVDLEIVETEQSKMLNDQLKILQSSRSMSMEDFNKIQLEEDNAALAEIARTKLGRELIAKTYHYDLDNLERQMNYGYADIGGDINNIFYSTIDDSYDALEGSNDRIRLQRDFYSKIYEDKNIYDRSKVLKGNLSKQFENIR